MIDGEDLKIRKCKTEVEITLEEEEEKVTIENKLEDEVLENTSQNTKRLSHEKTLNETIGDAIKSYDKKLKEEQKESGLKLSIDNYTMKQICRHMKEDDATKHQGFRNMEDSFMIVANYADYVKQAKRNGQEIRDYRDAIRMAENTARKYMVSHKSLFFFTDYGKERYKISCRILDILEGLKSETATAHEEFLKRADDKVKSASVADIIDEKEISEKEKGKLIDKWITEGDEYKELIKKIISSKELEKVDLETLERIIVDKNNILIANKVTISMITDENPKLTLGLSRFKEKLTDYINEKLAINEDSKKCIFSEVDEFRNKLRSILKDYEAENRELLERTRTRKAQFVSELGIDEYDQRFWVREDINALLLDTEDETFSDKLQSVKQRSDYNFEIIDQLVDELGLSSISARGIKKKIKNNLGDLLLYGGEMEVAQKVKDSLSYLAFLAPEEYAAEEKIAHLMNLYQIPKTDRDVFAKYLSGKAGLKGIVGMSTNKLLKKADTFVKNLGGIAKKEKIYKINKQMLKAETWEQIEKLKLRMGEFSDEEFKSKLDELIAANNAVIDLRKPNVKYSDYARNREQVKRKRNIGFSNRILGDLFLESHEISTLLQENEAEFFKKNLIKKLCPDDATVSEMEFLPTSEIKLIAGLLKDNLAGNAKTIKELQKDKEAAKYLPEILLEITLSKDKVLKEDVQLISQKVIDKHLYDEKLDLESKKMIGAYEGGKDNDATLDKERFMHFAKMLNHVKNFKDGRYSLFAAKLCRQKDFYEKLMSSDKKEIEAYLSGEVEEKIGAALDAVNVSEVHDAIKQIYLDRRFDLIYEGKVKGEIVLFKNELKLEQDKFFKERGTTAKKVDKNISAATNAALKEILREAGHWTEFTRESKEIVRGKVYGCAQELILNLYKDKDNIEVLMNKDLLKDYIKRGVTNYQVNKAYAENFLNSLSKDENSIFHGLRLKGTAEYVDAQRNMARFLSANSGKLLMIKKADFLGMLPELVDSYEKTYRKESDYHKENTVDQEAIKKARRRIGELPGENDMRVERDKFLGLYDTRQTINLILTSKSVVTIGKKNLSSLSPDNWQKTRDVIKDKLSKYFDVDPFLEDLLVEKNVNEFFGHELTREAEWLVNVADILKGADEGEEEISQDEYRLLVSNALRNIENFKDENHDGGYSYDRALIKGEWYKTFRKNYAALKQIEELEISFGPLQQERINITRDLRALLATGLGIKEGDLNAAESFAEKAKKSLRYVDYVNQFMTQADELLEEDETYKKMDPVNRDRYLLFLRTRYNAQILSDISGDGDFEYNSEKWEKTFSSFARDKALMKVAGSFGEEESVSNKTYGEKNKNFMSLAGRKGLEDVIKKYGSLQSNKKYNKLTPAQKELFALGLMLMEKGAIGFDQGSSQVLCCQTLREEEVGPRLKELQKYMADKDYDFKVDYNLCYYKLMDFGTFNGNIKMFSNAAFNKALEFAKGVTAKMKEKDKAIVESDKKLMGDGYTSIYTAAQYGRKQIEDVDELRKIDLSPEVVKQKLIEFAYEDESRFMFWGKKVVKREMSKDGKLLSLKDATPDVVNKEAIARATVLKRLVKMDGIEITRLIAVLQNRAVLDKSTADGSNHIDEEKREELSLMFSEDNDEGTFKNFVNPTACLQALVSALSFKMKDTSTFRDRKIERSDFDGVNFSRVGKIDWMLLDEAFKFLDEQKKERISRYAVLHAPDYIKATGNQKAIEAYDEEMKIAGDKQMEKDQFELFLKKQADLDRVSGENTNAKLALAGYSMLTDKQKKLFVKVLARRDFLDISQKNKYKNIIKASKERQFVNETGRFRLIDEYIEKSTRGNEGITLTETSYTEAFRSLLSTQVDDTVDFGSVKKVPDALAGEKFFIFKRDTAVDWKLFLRALQFVNRADYELEISEGNEELYRSAGKLSKYGKLSMDYSILRQNIHSTGNRFVRKGIQKGKKLITEGTLGGLMPFGEDSLTLTELKDSIKVFAKVLMPSLAGKMDMVEELLEDDEEVEDKRIEDLPSFMLKSFEDYDFGGMLEEKVKKKLFTSTESLTNEIGELVISSFKEGIQVDQIGDLVKKKLTTKSQTGSDSRLDEILGEYKYEGQYGDIRDQISYITGKYKKVKGTIEGIPDKIHDKVMDNIPMKELIETKLCEKIKEEVENQYTEAVAYVMSHVDEKTGELKEMALDTPLVQSVKEIVETYLAPMKETLMELKEMPQQVIDKVQEDLKEKVKDTAQTIAVNAFGEEKFKALTEKYESLKEFGQGFIEKFNFVIEKINRYKVFINGFRDIHQCIKNKNLLSEADERAHSKKTLKEDSKTLKKAEEVQSDRQKGITKNIVQEHRDMQQLSKKTAKTRENLAITKDILNMSIALGEEIFGDMDAGLATNLVKTAVKAGIDFALYCIRCIKDKNMLKTYYTETDKGKETVQKIKDSYTTLTSSEDVTERDLKGKSVLDIVCAGKGYEKEEELVLDTGNKMATSIAFCASKYNPIKETKVMACTVMVVLGLKSSIGKTDSGTINEIFNKMKAA